MRDAFSLVELSIVLVILGLLTGGILTGQNLIRAAELRQVSTKLQEYKAATYTFRERYFYLPGDLPNATDFWGALAAGGEGSSCFTVESTGTATCNGNGDGWIRRPAGWSSGDVWASGERYTYWTHLANAGLIAGQFTGRTDSTSDAYIFTPGKNVPAVLGDGHIRPFGMDFLAKAVNWEFEGMGLINILEVRDKVLTPEEAWSLDTKMDDGKPGQGMVFVPEGSSPEFPGCSDSDDPAEAEYSVQNTGKLCPLHFEL